MSKLPFFHLVKESSYKDKPSPLLVMVHGYGSNEDDLFSFARVLPMQLTIISIRGPISVQGMGYAWYDISFDSFGNKSYNQSQAIESRDKIIKCIDLCVETYNIDNKNISLMGFSQGAILINAIAITYPKKVKNVISLSGGIDPNILKPSLDYLNKINFYISHGTQDVVLPFNEAKESLKILNENKITYTFESFPVGHGVCPENFKSMLSWFEKKLR